MELVVFASESELANAAAQQAGSLLRDAIARKGHATFVAATGMSQFAFLEALVSQPDIDWSKTTMFHLDEYIGLLDTHPASFRLYLRQRLIDRVHPGTVYLINGSHPEPEIECQRLNQLISQQKVDILFAGIGENSHLAFNDPPADFEVESPYIVVTLDKACRRQQLGEGWFNTFGDVPNRAISMSIHQIMKASNIICVVPGKRKAQAVHSSLTGDVMPLCPASILRQHPNAVLYLDKGSASLLDSNTSRLLDLARTTDPNRRED